LLTVIIGEDRALIRDAIDVGRAVAHHAAIVGADIPIADIIAHDNKDVRLLLLFLRQGCATDASDASRTKPTFQLLFNGISRRKNCSSEYVGADASRAAV
jgi:hypothetical protein